MPAAKVNSSICEGLDLTADSAQIGYPANSSRLVDMDPSFDITVLWQQPSLPETAIYMNILNAMVKLTQQGFHSPVNPNSYTAPEYGEVIIGICRLPIPSRRTRLENRYVLWGLFQIYGIMVRTGQFQAARVMLESSGEEIGVLLVSRSFRPPNDLPQIVERADFNSTADSATGFEDSDDTDPDNAGRCILRVFYKRPRVEISRQSIFITVLGTIIWAAERPWTMQLDEFAYENIEQNTRTKF